MILRAHFSFSNPRFPTQDPVDSIFPSPEIPVTSTAPRFIPSAPQLRSSLRSESILIVSEFVGPVYQVDPSESEHIRKTSSPDQEKLKFAVEQLPSRRDFDFSYDLSQQNVIADEADKKTISTQTHGMP